MSAEHRPGDPGTDEWTFTKARWTDESLIVIDGSVAIIKNVKVVDYKEGEPPRGLVRALEETGFRVEHESVKNRHLASWLAKNGYRCEARGLVDFDAEDPKAVERWRMP